MGIYMEMSSNPQLVTQVRKKLQAKNKLYSWNHTQLVKRFVLKNYKWFSSLLNGNTYHNLQSRRVNTFFGPLIIHEEGK